MIDPNETAIVGNWIKVGGQVQGDEACARIKKLTENYLETLGTDQTGWETLYRDPNDGRYWERNFPQGEMHGSGPPAIRVVGFEKAKEKYPSVFGEV